MKKNDFGVFECVIPNKNGQPSIPHNSKVKVKKTALLVLSQVGTDEIFIESCRSQ